MPEQVLTVGDMNVPSPEALSEAELIRKAQAGSVEAFQDIHKMYSSRVRNRLFRLCPDADIDDLEQEVFIRVWKYLKKLNNVHTFNAWLRKICLNVCMDKRKSFAKQREHKNRIEENLEKAHTESAEQKVQNSELVARILAKLPMESRQIIVLFDMEELSLKEISDALEIPLGTVKSRLFNARRKAKGVYHSLVQLDNKGKEKS